MNKSDSSAGQQKVNTCNAEPRKFGPCTPMSVLDFFWNREDTWANDELEFLARSSECASHMAQNLADTVSNVGCVIASDYTPGSLRAGNFEMGDNVSSLLFVIADQIRTIGALTNIGSEAEFLLHKRGAQHV